MSLLREIQDAAIDSDTELAALLRKCKVLAARLGNDDFKQWVNNELVGYEDIESLPEYRKLYVNSKGHFSGPFQSGLRNADIPMSCVPKKLRDKLSHSYMLQSVAGLEALAEGSKSGTASEPWNPDIVAHFGDKIYEGMNCMQAWKVIPMTSVVSALDNVRNRILSFVLEIESEAPDAGEAAINSNPVPQEKIHQIFNTYITGDVQNIATGSTSVKQKAIKADSTPEVIEQLLKALKAATQNDGTVQLTNVAEEMKESHNTNEFKEHYNKFMSLLADHMQVLGPIVAPYLPALTALLP